MLAAVDSCFGLIGPHQHGTANTEQAQIPNIQAHSFFKGFSMGLVPLTREAIVPYLLAVSLPQHSYIQYSSHIPQA